MLKVECGKMIGFLMLMHPASSAPRQAEEEEENYLRIHECAHSHTYSLSPHATGHTLMRPAGRGQLLSQLSVLRPRQAAKVAVAPIGSSS